MLEGKEKRKKKEKDIFTDEYGAIGLSDFK